MWQNNRDLARTVVATSHLFSMMNWGLTITIPIVVVVAGVFSKEMIVAAVAVQVVERVIVVETVVGCFFGEEAVVVTLVWTEQEKKYRSLLLAVCYSEER